MDGSVSRTDFISRRASTIEWPTVALIVACYAIWLLAGSLYAATHAASVLLLALALLLHSSLQHEAIHRHPTPSARWNEALVWLPVGLVVPYRRFRSQHLQHHVDERLTDPYDDPESFYCARGDWDRLPRALRWLLVWNNTLVGRMIIGPAVSTVHFMRGEMRSLTRGGTEAREIRIAWIHHTLGQIALIAIVTKAFAMPLSSYLLAAYLARSVLAIRSFCEHRWAEAPEARTVIVENSLLGWLFLNNNLHIVHHTHPSLPWHALPAAYRARGTEWQALNHGYVFHGYGAVLRQFALRAKEPVAHPIR